MSNTILTHQMIAREAAKMLAENMPFIMNVNKSRQDDANARVNGYRKGGSLKIAIPPSSAVYTSNVFAGGGSTPDQDETYVNLTISTQKHVPMAFTAVEKALSLEAFRERFLQPAITTLCASVEADMISKAMLQVPNVTGTAGSVPTTQKVFSQARARLQRGLAPTSPRVALISDDCNVEMVDSSKGLFNPNREISDRFLNGYINSFAGFDFYECVNLPSFTNGQDVTGLAVDGAPTEGASVLHVDTHEAGTDFKAGQVFTIAGVYEVHPLTGVATTVLRQFVITSDVTNAGSETETDLPVYPPFISTGPGKTVSALPANDAALTFVGAASTSYRQNLVWQRDAIACAFAPLPVLAGCEGYTFDADGISLRVMTFGDGVNDLEKTRIDVLYADPVVLRRDHCCRVTE